MNQADVAISHVKIAKTLISYTNTQIEKLEERLLNALETVVTKSRNLYENRFVEFQGDQGIQGDRGIQGKTGNEGKQGLQGEKGIQGAMGLQGPKGLQGNIGLTGPQGNQGNPFVYEDFEVEQLEKLKGPQGEQGYDGKSFQFEDFTSTELMSLRGPKGEQGIIGEQGEQGAIGPQGNIGEQGEKGKDFTFDDFTSEQLFRMRGPQGDRGDQGIQGEKGDVGNLSDMTDDEIEFIKEAIGEVITPDSLSKILGEFRNDITTKLSNMVMKDVISTHSGGGEVNFVNLDDISEQIENITVTSSVSIMYDPVEKTLVFENPADGGEF